MKSATSLVITMGDPTGVGPEIILQAARQGAFNNVSPPVVVAGDLQVMTRAAETLGLVLDSQRLNDEACATFEVNLPGAVFQLKGLTDLDCAEQVYGSPNTASGKAMEAYIEWACRACLEGQAAGMITAPINKQALRLAGVEFPGHTELLAARCQVDDVVMMLAGKQLKVCLATTHCALRDVSAKLSKASLMKTITIANDSLQQLFAIEKPKLAVLALNPHAGDAGLFGREEVDIIAPAIEAARTSGINASGPHSPDSLFHFAVRGEYDAVVCMYHDQGLIPLKLMHFDDAVNITLGLPIVRTSVDHGTAYDLAGTGKASPASLVAALEMADEMAKKRRETRGARREARGKT